MAVARQTRKPTGSRHAAASPVADLVLAANKMDRLTSMGISRTARKFFEAAEILRSEKDKTFAPTYFCICQSIELSLKAFLRGSGYTDNDLRKIGHDLEESVGQARAAGLDDHFKFSAEDYAAIRQINAHYKGKDLQYTKSGFRSFPHVDILIDLGSRLWKSTRSSPL
jgi:hypothetical protein